VLARARAEAREPSAYWSDPTVGRLLFSSVVARALRSDANEPRHASAPPRASEETRSLLRAAEGQLEHDTFWDRALALVGWVRVGAADEAERVAAPLARAQASALRAEPAIAGRPLHDVASAVAAATTAIDAGEPEVARRAIAGALAREDLRRFRVPCARCDRGSIGIEEVREALADEG
jgi:hypothetical protein